MSGKAKLAGGRFKPPFTAPGIKASEAASLNNLRSVAAHVSEARRKTEVVFARYARDSLDAEQKLDVGDLGKPGYDRVIQTARNIARVDTAHVIPEALEASRNGTAAFGMYWSAPAVYGRTPLQGQKNSYAGKGDLADFLSKMIPQHRDELIQSWISDRSIGELGVAILTIDEVSTEITSAMQGQIPEFDKARACGASIALDARHLESINERLLQEEFSAVTGEGRLALEIGSPEGFEDVPIAEIEAAGRPFDGATAKGYEKREIELKQLQTEIAELLHEDTPNTGEATIADAIGNGE